MNNFIKFGLFFLLLNLPVCLSANSIGDGKRKSNFSLNAELNTKYVWRGIEFSDAPVIFGTLSNSNNGFNAFALGGYGVNGKHSEVDLGISYNYKWFTLGVSDYFFPSAAGNIDKYLDFNNHTTKHSLEGYLTIAPDVVPLWLTVSTYFWGGDKLLDGRQAYSSYLELGYRYDFADENAISFVAGANLNKGLYTNFKDGFNVVNLMVRYDTGIQFNTYRLPVSASFIYNPYTNKPYLSLSIYFK